VTAFRPEAVAVAVTARVWLLCTPPTETGPHLFEFSPTGVFYEYHAHSIGARSQSAKTYLEDHYAEFEDCE
jgi:20S proteasome subunit alpha 6